MHGSNKVDIPNATSEQKAYLQEVQTEVNRYYPDTVVGGPRSPKQRKYLPTFSDLIDRLTITQLKAIFIPEHREEYVQEMTLIQHDIDMIIDERGVNLTAEGIRAIMLVMLTNRYIWENESKAREGVEGQDKLLKLTHSINGVRNTAKNVLAKALGERLDYKVDCFAAELIKDFGNWQVWE